jgi:hypothetical protein
MTTDKNEGREALKQAEKELKLAEKLVKQATKQRNQEAEEVKKKEANLAKSEKKAIARLSSGIKDGKARLLVRAPGGIQQLNDFETKLTQVDGLKIKWTGGSKEEGPVIMLQGSDAVTIAQTLKSIPGIGDLKVQSGKILVTLNNVSV